MLNIMEVCGTHTNIIAKSGLKTLLADKINFISGPGCPVCVSAQSDINAMINLAMIPGTIITTFGDMLRVPGTHSTLQDSAEKGADVRLVYSPLDAVVIAQNNPGKKIVFLAVGFETTAPLIAACVLKAEQLKLKNFFIYCCLKTIAPAIKIILKESNNIDAFLLPGNVCVITGYKIFDFISTQYKKPAVVGGFTPQEVMRAVNLIASDKKPSVENAYSWAKPEGNRKAMGIIKQVFRVADGQWRGFNTIGKSVLELKNEFKNYDAKKVFKIKPQAEPKTACLCADILKGKITPKQCPIFGKSCTPLQPKGPCMVSVEGACAAWYNNLK